MNIVFIVNICDEKAGLTEASFIRTLDWPDSWRQPIAGDFIDPTFGENPDIDYCEVFAVYFSPSTSTIEVHLVMVTSLIDKDSARFRLSGYKKQN